MSRKQLSPTDLARYKKLGFADEADDAVLSRLIVSIAGIEKQGKSHFALTAPGPIAIFNLDVGLEGVVGKFTPDKQIIPYDILNSFGDPEAAKEAWPKFMKALEAVLRDTSIRTVIIDTATQLWALLRLARFGQLAQIMPFQYAPVNAEYKGMLDLGYGSNKNFILIHKMRPVYINDKRTKDLERDGFGDTGARVQVNLQAYRDEPEEQENGTIVPGEFHMYIRDCRQNPDIAGQTLDGVMCDFSFLATMALPDTDMSDWE